MARLLIKGKITYVASEINNSKLSKTESYILKEISLYSNKDESFEPLKETVKANDIYEIVTTDGVVWIVSGNELLNNYAQKSLVKRGKSTHELYELRNELSLNEKRGLGEYISLKKIIKWALNKTTDLELRLPGLISKIDKSLVPHEGLFGLAEDNTFSKKINLKKEVSIDKSILLFIHGTLNHTQGSFGDLFSQKNDPDWEALKSKNTIIAFEHHTLSKSPLQNALDLVKLLDDGIKINLVTSSRGGLIGELLTMVSAYKSNPIYLESMFNYLSSNNRKEDATIVNELIKQAQTKTISITDYHRIACPALGTTLASKRLDNYLKVVLNLIGLIPIFKASLIYDQLKSLLLTSIKIKANTNIFPGIEAMMPESPFITSINICHQELVSNLKIIAGDVEPEGFFKTIAVFLTDIFYRTEHDFIVNSYSMFGGIKRTNTFYLFHKGNNVNHLSYFFNSQTRKVLYASLKDEGTEGMFALPKNDEKLHSHLESNPLLKITRGLYTDQLKKISTNNLIYSGLTENKKIEAKDKIVITIKHGDLGYAMYPLIVGHFKDDGIVAAEKVIDEHMNFRLSQIHAAEIYPGAVETSEVFFNTDSAFKGAVVIGLGEPGELTEESLTNAFQHGILNLALKSKTFLLGKKQIGVSSLLVGSDYAGISIRASIRSLINGISKANQQIRYLNDPEIPIIKHLEIIELYYHRAVIATKFINANISVEYKDQLKQKGIILLQKVSGAQKRFTNDYSPEWWYRLQISAETDITNKITALNYLLMNNGAKADAMRVPVQGEFLENLIKTSISEGVNDASLSKLLFNILLPNSIKEFTNDKRNILIIVDSRAADIPWEMLFNQNKNADVPVAIKSGMIRQLKVESNYSPITHTALNNVLIIANPLTNDKNYPDLDGARQEGKKINEILSADNRFNCLTLIDKTFIDIMKGIINKPYRIMHLAGHGEYDAENSTNTGMILGNGIRITPAEIAKLTYVPELVFINCCFLGKTKQAHVRWNELAANLGTEFIKCGVKCIIAAGWGVDDEAANLFAENFYQNMLKGSEFGEATQQARSYIYNLNKTSNTWGAYQCYGDPFYKFIAQGNSHKINLEPFIDVSEIIVELENCFQQINPKSTRNNSKQIEEKINEIEKLVNLNWKDNPEIIETLANCYHELGNQNKALEKYKTLLSLHSGKYKLSCLYKLSRLAIDKGVILVQSNSSKKEGRALINLAHQTTKNLLNISKTADKYILKGGNLKREATIYQKNEIHKRIKKLEEAETAYKTAFNMILKNKNEHDNYSLQNWIVIEVILKAYKKSATIDSKLFFDYINKALIELKNSNAPSNTFTYNSTIAELQTCDLMLGKKTNKTINSLELSIYKKYREGWEIDGSFAKANIILTQFDLVIFLLKEAIEPKKSVLTSLEKLKIKLEKLFKA